MSLEELNGLTAKTAGPKSSKVAVLFEVTPKKKGRRNILVWVLH